MIIQPNKRYTFAYLNAPPVTWVVDVVNAETDQVYLHQVGADKTLQMSLYQFERLYRLHGVGEGV